MSKNINTCCNCGRMYSKDNPLLVEIYGEPPKPIYRIMWRGILDYSNLCKDCLRMALRVIQDSRRIDPKYMDDFKELKIIN